jgi:transposase
MKVYPLEFRQKVLEFVEKSSSIPEAVEIFGVSRDTIYKWKRRAQADELAPKSRAHKKPYKLDYQLLMEYVERHPDAFLHEIAAHFGVSHGGIFDALKKMGISRKKKAFTYAEGNEQLQAEFEEKISKKKAADLIFLDESGLIDNLTREYARAPKGQKIPAKKSGKRTTRINLIAAYSCGKSFAHHAFQGRCNAYKFNDWLKNHLVPKLRHGQTIILDNATFHKSKKTKELIKKAHCEILFLPPYSPQYNPIEHYWANLKRTIKNTRHQYQNLQKTLQNLFDPKLLIQI